MARLGRARPKRIIQTQLYGPRTLSIGTLTGSVTPGATLTASTIVKALAGSTTPNGTVTKTATRALAGSTTPSGAVAPLKVKVLAARTGSAQPSATITPRVVVRNLTGLITPTGAISKNITRGGVYSGTVTPSSTVTTARTTIRAQAGTVTPSGATRKVVTRNLGGQVTPSGAVGPKTTTRRLTASPAPSGAVFPLRLPATGLWVAPPKALDQSAVLGSLVTWQEDVPAGARLRVKSSVDGGATYQVITNGGEIPRLAPGRPNPVKVLLMRIEFFRNIGADPAPTIHRLRILIQQTHNRIEWMPLGQFSLVDVDVNESSSGIVIDLSAGDLSTLVSDNAWEKIYTFPKDTNLGDVLKQGITNRYPAAVFDFETTNAVAPAPLVFGANAENDPWEDFRRVAAACEGKELYVDWRGVFVLRTPPDPETTPPVWGFSGRDRPTMTELTRRLTKTGSANVIVVEGESTGNTTQVRAQVEDNDPTSPNNVAGPEGRKVYRVSTKLAKDNATAMAMAQGLALRKKGALETVEFTVVPVGHLEETDVVTIAKATVGLSGAHLIDRMAIPLGADEDMRIAARRRRLEAATPGGNVGGLDGEEPTDNSGGGGGDGGGGDGGTGEKVIAYQVPTGMTGLIDQDPTDSQLPWKLPTYSDHVEIWFYAPASNGVTSEWLGYLNQGAAVWNQSPALDCHVTQSAVPAGKNKITVRVQSSGDDGNFDSIESGGFTVGGDIQLLSSLGNTPNGGERRNVAAHEMGHAVGLKHRNQTVLMNSATYNNVFTADATEYKNLLWLYARQRPDGIVYKTGSTTGGGGGTGTGGGGSTGGGTTKTYTTPGECHKIGTNGDLNHFRLQTAYGSGGVQEISNAQIGAGYSHSPEYALTADKTAVTMRVSLSAGTTPNSSNPRTEYREVNRDNTTKAAWTPDGNLRWCQATFRFSHLAVNNQACTALQIHDAADDVLQLTVRKDGGVLKIGYRKNGGDFIPFAGFSLNQWWTVRIGMQGGTGRIWAQAGENPVLPADPTASFGLTQSGGCYFKIGTYSQLTSEESSSDYASGEFKRLGLFHPGYPPPVFD